LGKHEIVWSGEAMRRVMAQVERVAANRPTLAVETYNPGQNVAQTFPTPRDPDARRLGLRRGSCQLRKRGAESCPVSFQGRVVLQNFHVGKLGGRNPYPSGPCL